MRIPLILATLSVVAAAGLAPGEARARARCACLCVDGAWKTVCTDPRALAGQAALCRAHANQACPAPPQASVAPQRYAAPTAGVGNCRDAQVYDAATDSYVTARVCDTVSAGADDAPSG